MFQALEVLLVYIGNVHKVNTLEKDLSASGRTKDPTGVAAAVLMIMNAFGNDVEWIAA